MKFTKENKEISVFYLLFLVLAANLVLSSIVVPNNIGNYRDDAPSSANFMGYKSIDFTVNETQLIAYRDFPVNSHVFSLQFNNWDSEFFDITLSNITNNNLENKVIQDRIEDGERVIPIHGSVYQFQVGENTYINKPMELGTDFFLDKPWYITHIDLNVGFHVFLNTTHRNLEEMQFMINNATVDIRQNDGGSPISAPMMYESIKSIPLNQSLIQWDRAGSTYIGKTLGNAINSSNAQEGMLQDCIIRVPVDLTLEAGTYWTVINSMTVHNLIRTVGAEYFRIDVFAFDNNTDDSHFVHRAFDNGTYTLDVFNLFDEPLADVYQIIGMKAVCQPVDIDLRIDNKPVEPDGTIQIEDKTSHNSKLFLVSSNYPVSFKADIDAFVKRSAIAIESVEFEPADNSIRWFGSVPIQFPVDGCVIKNTTIVLPDKWNIDIATLKFFDGSGTALNCEIDGTTGIVFIQHTEILGSEIRFEVYGYNIISSISGLGALIEIPTEIKIKCDGIGEGAYLALDLYCNGTSVKHLISGASLNQDLIISLNDCKRGSGYTIRGFWDNGSTNIGCIESNSFEIKNENDVDPDNPGGDGNNSNNPFENLNLSSDTVIIIVVVISGLTVMQVVRKGKKKVKVPKLAKFAVDKQPGGDNIDDWF